MDPFFHTGLSISDSLKTVRKSVLIYETIIEYGMKFFEGVGERYTEYAKSLEGKLGIPYEKLTPLIFILVRACVHYALFENEFYMKSQIEVLKETLGLFIEKYK